MAYPPEVAFTGAPGGSVNSARVLLCLGGSPIRSKVSIRVEVPQEES
jgi:hypothetical protein